MKLTKRYVGSGNEIAVTQTLSKPPVRQSERLTRFCYKRKNKGAFHSTKNLEKTGQGIEWNGSIPGKKFRNWGLPRDSGIRSFLLGLNCLHFGAMLVDVIGFQRQTVKCYSIRHLKLWKFSTRTSGRMESAPNGEHHFRFSRAELSYSGLDPMRPRATLWDF